MDYNSIFSLDVDQSNKIDKTNNFLMTSKKFVISERVQFSAEVFYDPSLYDIQIFIESKDANLVRSHFYGKAPPKVEWSKYKSSKRVLVELEKGEYEIQFI